MFDFSATEMIDFDMSPATVAEETSEPTSESQGEEGPSSSSFSSTPAGSQFGEKGERIRSASVRRAPISDPSLAQNNKTVLI